jgi:hypothetical protein
MNPWALATLHIIRVSSPPHTHTHMPPRISPHACPPYLGAAMQSTGLVRHVFRLLRCAKEVDRRPVPWVMLENVGGCAASICVCDVM